MFCRGECSVFFDSARERSDEFSDAFRVFAEGTRVDNWIVGIVIDVGHWPEYPIHAAGARLERRDFSHRVGVFRISGCGDRHGIGKGSALVEAHGCAAFEISGDKKWQLRTALELV